MELQPLGPLEARAALERIDHIVIVMMENRSFDHMLGYLTLDGRTEIDGLQPSFSNGYLGRPYGIHKLSPGRLEHWEDPDHSGAGVDVQVAGNNGGFAKNYIESRPREYRDALVHAKHLLPMGYYDGATLTTYHHLASHFCVCDRWFSSVPGATWPNRLYGLCGQSAGRRDNKKLFGKIDWPLQYLPSFVRALDKRKVSWRWYHAHLADLEPPTLQVADARYFFRSGDHFALFDRTEPGGQASFLDDAAGGNLMSVSWVDPDFGVTKHREQNDDHPPADVRKGQAFVARVVNALMEGDAWRKTLLVVTYDEHGGFFDHVPPPPAIDDDLDMRRYGVRVPAMVVCPYVEAESVSHQLFDHTSIIRTVFERFCVDSDDGTLPWYGSRVANANHVGSLLTLNAPRTAVPVPEVADVAAPGGAAEPMTFAEQRALAAPRPANISAEPMLRDWAGVQPATDLQLGLIRAGLERQETPAP
jgi:phospholipase C